MRRDRNWGESGDGKPAKRIWHMAIHILYGPKATESFKRQKIRIIKIDPEGFFEWYTWKGGCQMISSFLMLPDDMALLGRQCYITLYQ